MEQWTAARKGDTIEARRGTGHALVWHDRAPDSELLKDAAVRPQWRDATIAILTLRALEREAARAAADGTVVRISRWASTAGRRDTVALDLIDVLSLKLALK